MTKGTAVFLAILLSVLGLALAMDGTSGSGYWKDENYDSGLKFSHKLHVQDRGIGCEDCHTAVKASLHSSDRLIGDHQSCTTCHEEQISTKCAYCHSSIDSVSPAHQVKPELIFSHHSHTENLKVSCEHCHAGVENASLATSRNMPLMSACISCHNEHNAAIQCEACHTDFITLVPADHRAADFRRHHKEQVRVGMLDVSCRTCHVESFCQDCHTGTELKNFGSDKDLMVEPGSRTSTKDSPKQLRLQQVHSLNYRFTHGVDAKSKLLDCSSCHEQQTFCSTCHEAGGNISQGKIKPASHTMAGFTTIGKGSGGGRHADLARRDLEACMSCHDVQGSDPTCALCHTENGVR
ncbi:MAG TPA: hypothetical protein VL633_03680 [Bacteroidota bacterium]|nr:hypothetical protein [Bacteroidota bacterium]